MAPRRKTISKATREHIVNRQHHRCANNPINVAVGCKRYLCPLWAMNHRDGVFDEAGFEIDHIVEVSHGGCDELDNLQALCPSCHRVKTRRFRNNKYMFPSPDLHDGRALMEIVRTDPTEDPNDNESIKPALPHRRICKRRRRT